MKRIDKLILGELMGPWVFGVAIFTTLIMAGTYLFKMTEYLVQGVSFGVIFELTMLMLPGVMVKTFPMAVLLSTLLAFGRLSSDSEIVAMRAAGASLGRIMVPVGAFGVLVAIIAFGINEQMVPFAAYRGTELIQGVEKKLKGGETSIVRDIYDPTSGRRVAQLVATDFNLEKRSLANASMIAWDSKGQPIFFLYTKGMRFTNEENWEIEGGKLFSFDLTIVMDLGRTWPSQMPNPPTADDIAAAGIRDLDVYNMQMMRKRIAFAKKNPAFDKEQIRNLEYGLHNKVALPLAAMIFGLVGAPLGIRNHRTGAAAGFWLSVLIIFAYMMLTRFMSLWALGGKIPPWAASYLPLVIGLVVAVETIRRKNV